MRTKRLLPALALGCTLALSACGDDESRTIRLNAGPAAGASGATMTYVVNGESTSVTLADGDDLGVDVSVEGEIDIEIVVTNTDDEGGVHCSIGGIGLEIAPASGTETATCRAEGTVTSSVSATSLDYQATDRDGAVLFDARFTVDVPEGYPEVSLGTGRVTFEGESGTVRIEETPSRADSPADFADRFGGDDTSTTRLGELEGALTRFEAGEMSFVAAIDDKYHIFTTDSRDDDQLDVLTVLVQSIAS